MIAGPGWRRELRRPGGQVRPVDFGVRAFQREPRHGDRAVAEPCREARTGARVGAGVGEAVAASAWREARRRRKGNRESR